ncbi:hypothetical protein [Gordonia paraffinivorans]
MGDAHAHLDPGAHVLEQPVIDPVQLRTQSVEIPFGEVDLT